MRDLFINFRKSESGATLVEYGVALLLAIVLGGGALVTLANQTDANMDAACDSLLGQGQISGVAGCGT
ncbi:MAG: hypothetical protein OIF48_20890 [Silicimonas sp.]|nr:hypothetical protein [Silicimonas sp.]